MQKMVQALKMHLTHVKNPKIMPWRSTIENYQVQRSTFKNGSSKLMQYSPSGMAVTN